MPDHAYALRDDLQAQDIQLDQLFLDPNNPRFAGSGWQDVPEDRIVLESTQSEVLQRLLDDFEVSKLRANMEINGFLPIDRIVVRQLSGDAYVVLKVTGESARPRISAVLPPATPPSRVRLVARWPQSPVSCTRGKIRTPHGHFRGCAISPGSKTGQLSTRPNCW